MDFKLYVLLLNKNPVDFCKSHVARNSNFAREGDNLVSSHTVSKYLGYVITKREKKTKLFQ